MPNLTKLEDISSGETAKTVTLSPETINLCLSLLDAYAVYYAWRADENGQFRALTTAEIDRAEQYTAQAVTELLTETEAEPMTREIGEIAMFASVPAGWLACNGQELSRETYADLFAVIGTTWGNAGPTTFTLPDFRGQSPQGVDVPNSEIMGMTVGTKMQTSLPQHLHTINYAGSAGSEYYLALSASKSLGGTINSNNTGTSGGVDQRGPRLIIFFAIYTGVV